MSQVTHLASGALTRSGDQLLVELVPPDSMPAVVRIVWPAKPSVTAPTPKALAALRQRWFAAWRRRRRNSRRSGTADDQQSCQAFVMPSRSSCEGSSKGCRRGGGLS
jgi:hypothetical protein